MTSTKALGGLRAVITHHDEPPSATAASALVHVEVIEARALRGDHRTNAMPPEDGEINVDLGAELADLLDAGRSGDADPEDVQRGLAALVLTLVEVLRELMERRAIRRRCRGR